MSMHPHAYMGCSDLARLVPPCIQLFTIFKFHMDNDYSCSKTEKSEQIAMYLYRWSLFPLQSHPNVWPFLEPVNEDEAPDYHEIIKYPIGK